MPGVGKYLDGINLPIGTVKSVVSSPFTADPNVIIDNGTWIKTGAVYLQSNFTELYQRIGLINASSFTPRTSNTTSQINAATYGNGTYVYAGSGGAVGTSTDAVTWTQRTSASYNINGLAWGANVFVRAGDTGYTGYSTDGVSWTNYSVTSRDANTVNTTLAGNVYVSAGSLNLRTSTDLRTWTTPTYAASGTVTFNASAYDGTANAAADLQEVSYYTPGTYYWTVPTGVTSISAVCVGGGGGGVNSASGGAGGNGADLRYSSNIAVTPGETLTVVVGSGGSTTPITTSGAVFAYDGAASQIWSGTSTSNSVYFDGNSRLTTATNSAFNLSGNSFTIEFWVYIAQLQVVPNRVITIGPNSAASSFTAQIQVTGQITFGIPFTGTTGLNTPSSIPIGAWTHVAYTQSGTTGSIYINGVLDITGTVTSVASSNTNYFYIGYDTSTSVDGKFTGYLSNVRLVRSVVYTGNFTPPTSPLTNIANTSILTCQSSTFIDNSTNNFTITTVGSPSISTISPFGNLAVQLSAAGGGGGTTAATPPRSQNGLSSTIGGNIGGGSGGIRRFNTTTATSAGGGGAGGYSGDGGRPGAGGPAGNGEGGGGGGGGGSTTTTASGAGGGVSLMGERISGSGGALNTAGTNGSVGAAVYCGGGGAGADTTSGATAGQSGGVRIIWGAGRSYPSTNTAPTAVTRYGVAGSSGYIANSLDDVTWTVADTGTTTEFTAMTYGNGIWTAGGTGGVISYSTNGTAWNTLPPADRYTNQINATAYAGNVYVFTGSNILKTSTDLRTWSTPTIYGMSTATINGDATGNITGNVTAQQVDYYTPGYYSWTVPAGVTSISAVTVGGGGGGVQSTSGGAGGNGADLRYSSNIAVTPGETLTVVVGSGGAVDTVTGGDGAASQIWTGTSTSNSVYFDGAGDYLAFPDNTVFNFGTGDFTVEAWVYRTSTGAGTSAYESIIGGNTSTTSYWNLYVNSSNNTIVWFGNDGTLRPTTSSITNNTWTHVAVARSGTTLKIFINGVEGYSATVSTSYSLGTSGGRIGFDGPNGVATNNKYFAGYISNVRAVKGTAVYTSNFTPSTTPLTAIANTSLLTCQSTTFKDNSTNNFFIDVQGNSQTTPLSPFGNLTVQLSAAGGGGGTIAAVAARAQNGLSSTIAGNIGGGNGGIRQSNTTTANSSGGGGAGGYSGAGGNPGVGAAGSNGAGGGGGGGGGSTTTSASGAGGGVSLMGERASGTGGTTNVAGTNGSIGAAVYVGGGGAGVDNTSGATAGQSGGVRIIWGAGRSYPSTNTGPVYEAQYVVAGDGGYAAASSNGTDWIIADTKTTTQILAMTWGNGTYVYAGAGGLLATSTDGANWTAQTSGTASAIRALTYGNGRYVYAGDGGVLRTSTDGITWDSRTSGTVSIIRALTFGNNLYVYGGQGGVLRSSTDGITWDSRTSNTTSIIYGLAYGNGTYVYVGAGGAVGTSTDATTWTARTSGTTSLLLSVTYGNGLFVASGTGGTETHRYSTDGVEWFSYTSGTTSAINALTYGNNLYVYGGSGGVLGTSTDGQRWVVRTSGTASIIRAMTYGNGVYVLAGDGGVLRTSTDGITWSAQTSGTTSAIYGLSYGNGMYAYAAGGGLLASSTNAVTWVANTSGTASIFYAMSYGNSIFFASGVGGSETHRYSTDGVEWYSYTMGTTSNITALTYGNNLFVAGGVGGVLRTSTDGDRWVMRNSSTTSNINALTYGNNLYVYAGTSGAISTSTNAISWTARTAVVNTIFSLTYGNGVYVTGGWTGQLSTSTDGITWTARTSGTTSSIYALTYGNGRYVYGGIGSVLRSSTDAVTWDARVSGNTNALYAALTPSTGRSIFAGSSGWLGTSDDLTINQYSPAYNASTEFYVPHVTAGSFGTLETIAAAQVGITQTIYVKAKQ